MVARVTQLPSEQTTDLSFFLKQACTPMLTCLFVRPEAIFNVPVTAYSTKQTKIAKQAEKTDKHQNTDSVEEALAAVPSFLLGFLKMFSVAFD